MMRSLLSVLLVGLASIGSAAADELPGAMPLTTAFAEKLVNAELAQTGRADGFKVTIVRPRLPLGNQDSRPTRIVLDGLRHDPASGRFSAVMIGTIGDEPRFELPMEGKVEPLVTAAVLARPVRRGQVISAADLDWKQVAPDSLAETSLIHDAELIGAEARRQLSPGRVLTNRDVGPPRLVLRGQPVRVVYADGGLKLTALGTARNDGAFGDAIRVVNPESRLEVQGIATGHQEVTVGSTARSAAGS